MNSNNALKNHYKIHRKFLKIMESLPSIKIMLNNMFTTFSCKIGEKAVGCAPHRRAQRPPNAGDPTCTAGHHLESKVPHDLSTSLLNPLEDGWSSPPLEAHSTDTQHSGRRSIDDRTPLVSTRVPH